MHQALTDLPAMASEGQQRRSLRLVPSTLRCDSLDTSTTSTPAARSSRSTPAIQSSRSTPGEGCSCKTPQESAEIDEEPTSSKRIGLRRKREEPREPDGDPMGAAMKPLTDEERRSWPGWVELESEPTLFNYILREYGVKDVKVQEVWNLEDEALSFLPKPVYGLIFLFRYWDEEEDEEEAEELTKCPNYVWFANQAQTITNACATIALLNIVMNVPKVDLGEKLSAFKEVTKGLKPPYRGQELGENEFIRNIHNSFARRMDMLNADLALSNEVDEWNKAQRAKKRKGASEKSQGKATRKKKKKDDEEPGFHFIAFVPINGSVWRLDGMQHQPVSLGEAGKNWMELARENINIRIAQHDTDLQYNLMALCRSPLRNIPEQLAENLHSLSAVENSLNSTFPDWKAFTATDETSPPLPFAPNDCFALSKELFANTTVSDSVQRKLRAATDDPTMLIDMRLETLTEQTRLQKSYIEEIAAIEMENEQAARRKIDYTPVIYNSIKELADQGVLEEIVKDLVAKGLMEV